MYEVQMELFDNMKIVERIFNSSIEYPVSMEKKGKFSALKQQKGCGLNLTWGFKFAYQVPLICRQ